MTRSAFHGYEFTIDTVTGVRGYRQDSLGRLAGVTHARVMKPGINVAECSSCGTEELATCTCGYYAYFSDHVAGKNLREEVYGAPVGAIVRGTGRVVVGTNGFRAEKAELLALFPTDRPGPSDKGHPGPVNRFTRHLYPTFEFMKNRLANPLVAAILIVSAIVFGLLASLGVAGAEGSPPFPIPVCVGILAALPYWVGLIVRVWQVGIEEHAAPYNPKFRHAKPKRSADPSPFDQLRELYPDVPIYDSFAKAAKAHPLTDPSIYEPEKPTPKNTDDFWDIDDPEGHSYVGSDGNINTPGTVSLGNGSIHFRPGTPAPWITNP